jgi:hypothetical protein
MRSDELNKVKLLEEALAAAYRKEREEEFKVSREWRPRLIRSLRQLSPPPGAIRPNYYPLFNRLVWRFAAVAGLVALILSVYVFVFNREFLPEYELLTTFTNDPDSAFIAQF